MEGVWVMRTGGGVNPKFLMNDLVPSCDNE